MKQIYRLFFTLIMSVLLANVAFANEYPAPKPVETDRLCFGTLTYGNPYPSEFEGRVIITDPLTGDVLYDESQIIPPSSVVEFTVYRYFPSDAIIYDLFYTYTVAIIMRGQEGINPNIRATACDGVYFSDGRVQWTDGAAPAIAYGNAETGIVVYEAKENASEILSISASEIATAGVPDSGSIILAEGFNADTGKGVVLSRLSDGQFQLDTQYADGKAYSIRWTLGWMDYTFVTH